MEYIIGGCVVLLGMLLGYLIKQFVEWVDKLDTLATRSNRYVDIHDGQISKLFNYSNDHDNIISSIEERLTALEEKNNE